MRLAECCAACGGVRDAARRVEMRQGKILWHSELTP